MRPRAVPKIGYTQFVDGLPSLACAYSAKAVVTEDVTVKPAYARTALFPVISPSITVGSVRDGLTSKFFSSSFSLVLTASCGNRTGNLVFPAGRTGRTLTGYQLGYFAFGYQRQQRDDGANLRSYALTLPLATSAMDLDTAVAVLVALWCRSASAAPKAFSMSSMRLSVVALLRGFGAGE